MQNLQHDSKCKRRFGTWKRAHGYATISEIPTRRNTSCASIWELTVKSMYLCAIKIEYDKPTQLNLTVISA